jgi:holo-[acyl-carrier protein] synthase
MILGIGTDIVDIERFAATCRRRPRILDRLFTPEERKACENKKNPCPSLAARFAAKEACMKALGTGWGKGVGFGDIVVEGGTDEPPRLTLHGGARRHFEAAGGTAAHLSLSHDKGLAMAFVVLEGTPEE